jgi:hypothetical protein
MIARGLAVYRPSPGGKILIKPEDLDAFMLRQQAQPMNVLDDLLEELKTKNGKAGTCVNRTGLKSKGSERDEQQYRSQRRTASAS